MKAALSAALAASWLIFAPPLLGAWQQFRSFVELVVVDFLAEGKDGAFVGDLAMNELRLSVDGRPRPIRQVNMIRIDSGTATAPAPPRPANPGVAPVLVHVSNARRVYLLFDEDSMRPGEEHAVVEGARAFIRNLPPADALAVIPIPFGNAHLVPSTERDGALAALDKIRGRLPAPPLPFYPEKQKRACDDYERSRRTLAVLHAFLADLGEPIADPRVVILVSGGILPAAVDKARAMCPTSIDPGIFIQLERVAAALRTRFYVIQPHSMMIDASSGRFEPEFLGFTDYHAYLDGQAMGLEDIAGAGGGEMMRAAGRADGLFDRIVRETAGYYLLGFEPIADDRDGKPHKIKLDVSRRGVRVRVRPTFRLGS